MFNVLSKIFKSKSKSKVDLESEPVFESEFLTEGSVSEVEGMLEDTEKYHTVSTWKDIVPMPKGVVKVKAALHKFKKELNPLILDKNFLDISYPRINLKYISTADELFVILDTLEREGYFIEVLPLISEDNSSIIRVSWR